MPGLLRGPGGLLLRSAGGLLTRCEEDCCDEEEEPATTCEEAEAMLAAAEAEGGTFRLLCNNVELGFTTPLTEVGGFPGLYRSTMTIGGDCVYILNVSCAGLTDGRVLVEVDGETDCPGIDWGLVLNAASFLSGAEVVMSWGGFTTDDSCTCGPTESCEEGDLFEVQYIP